MIALGFDTSNYTTSVAAFDGTSGENCSRLLDVKPGELGLRQSDAVFSHIKRLPELSDRLFHNIGHQEIAAIGVSTRPRSVEGSYMPCFLAGQSHAQVLASALGVPVYEFSHQQGHIAASLWGAERMDLMDKPHLAWHLSGGTTELLLVTPDGVEVKAEKIGGTTDISAGQLIDRTGLLLGLQFPCGKALDALADPECQEKFSPKVNDFSFSLSGAQNKVQAFFEATKSPEKTAAFCLNTVISAILKATKNARKAYPGMEVVFAGGVASNSRLRRNAAGLPAVFCPAQYSTDNAMGIAVLTWRRKEQDGISGL
ncbi:MAG: DNA-binding protein [Clostridia bacterium]|nr:DNA-binding protein [Clostridia bacterium]